ncbi:putative adipose-regulatory protein (Seipin) domain-containing protein [Phthorimaea operculella]|nr:putative adipose-regulatory protein (Seipin) domain-containing protein [Phthorimaea operculella]
MPNVTHVRPVHLQFKSCEENMGICSFPSAHVQLTKRSHMLMAAQPYRIKLILEMPESQINKDLGMFMVCAQMRAKGGVLVSSSCRSAMLRYRLVLVTWSTSLGTEYQAEYLIIPWSQSQHYSRALRRLVVRPHRSASSVYCGPIGANEMVLEKLNDEQMEILLDFADRCRYLCFGRPPTGRDAEIIAYKQWKELSRDLNYAGNLPWKSGREWKMYWTELKNKTKAKLATAKRRSKFTGEPLHLNNFSLWEQRIIELAEVAAKEPRTKHVFSENGDGDTTDSIPNDSICEPKFESTPNTSQNGNSQVTPLDMSNTYTTQLQPDATHTPDATYAPDASHAADASHAPQYVSTGTQMVATPGIKKSMPPPIMHGYSVLLPASTMSMMTTRSMHAEKTMAKLQQRLTEAEQINEKLLVERDEIDLEMKQLKSKTLS